MQKSAHWALFKGVAPIPNRISAATFTLSQVQLQQTQATMEGKQTGRKSYFLCAFDSINDTFQDIQYQQIGARSSVQLCSCHST